MQCDDVEIGLCATPTLSELDSALHELGMLASLTDARQDYTRELQRKHLYHMFRIKSRCVSNVSIGFQLRPSAPHVRYKPYTKKREERHRTRSENNDCEGNLKGALEEVEEQANYEVMQLKKAKSLESIIVEGNTNVDLNALDIPEVQVVSDLEKLRVGE